MELTSNTFQNTLNVNSQKPDFVVIDLGGFISKIRQDLNLLPQEFNIPSDEILLKMALEAAKARVNPAPHVIRAKCLNMFKEADQALIDTIFVSIFALSLTFVERFNQFQLWSESGYAMYEFHRFINDETVELKKVYRIE